MKDLIKFFSIITGLFRSIISILLFFAIGFIVFVDNNLYLAAFDLIGITNIARSILKPLSLILVLIAFIINTIVARNIFKAGENGKSHPSNIFFALIFLAIDGFLLMSFREKLLFILIGLNGLLLLNSLIGLIGKVRGIYQVEGSKQTKTEYIEINQNNTDNSENLLKADDVKLLKNEEVKFDGETKIKTSQLIDKNTDSESEDSDKKDESKITQDNASSDASKTYEKAEEENPVTLADLKEEEKSAPKEDKENKNKSDELVIKETNLDDLKKKSHEDSKTNKVIVSDNDDMTYDPDLAEDFQKAEDERIYDKSTFVREEAKE